MNFSAMTTTQAVNIVYLYVFGFCIFLLIGITATMIYFVVKYDHKKHPKPERTRDSIVWLETTWIVIPALIALSMFYFGWKGYQTLIDVPPGAMVVHVTGQQWVWSFKYPNGVTSKKLYVPVNRPIKLELTSKDVIHSFFVPAFRIKKDCVPGMTTYEWFRAPKKGSYDAFCAQYCGVGHSQMTTKVVVMAENKFQDWYHQQASAASRKKAVPGKALLSKYGCTGCHSLDGSKGIGPTFKGLYGSSVTVTTNGKTHSLTVDAAYIKRSIEAPNADIVKGFQPEMPSFAGKISDKEIDEIIRFFKQKSGQSPPASKPSSKPAPEKSSSSPKKTSMGKKLAAQQGCMGCHSTDGSKGAGPTWKGLYGSKVTVTTNGKEHTLTADAPYIIRSIKHPKADIVKGFHPIMPPAAGLSKRQINAIVDYIKTLQ